MDIKKKLYAPFILTIPDDAVIFSLFDQEEKIGKKIIMENYINFYSFLDREYDYIVFRFEDFLHYESTSGLERCFIPIEIIQKYHRDLDIVIQLLLEGYIVTIPVARRHIPFYNEKVGNHLITVYGINTEKKIMYCKDFNSHNFVEFETSIEDIRNGLLGYTNPFAKEGTGVLAVRINTEISPTIEYSKVFSKFSSLWQDIHTDQSGYGIGAIELFLDDVERKREVFLKPDSWYFTANYLREAAKLIKFRYLVLKDEADRKQGSKLTEKDTIIKKLIYDTNELYLNISKFMLKNKLLSNNTLNEITALVKNCKMDFMASADFICNIISDYII